MLGIQEEILCCEEGYVEHSTVCRDITTFKHGERQLLQLAADRFVLEKGYYSNFIPLRRKNNENPECKKF